MNLTPADELRIRNLEKSVGQPDSEHPKSLYEIVAALNKELLELKLKIKEMELQEKKNMNEVRTKEAIEYEKGLKNLHELSLKKAMSEDGIDTSKVTRKKLDEVRRLVDKQEPVRRKHQETINKAQQEANAAITKIQQDVNATVTKAQQDMQAEIAEIQKEVEEVIKSIQIEQGIIKPIEKTEPESPGEEVKPEPEEAK